jgi:hypothetical protein
MKQFLGVHLPSLIVRHTTSSSWALGLGARVLISQALPQESDHGGKPRVSP